MKTPGGKQVFGYRGKKVTYERYDIIISRSGFRKFVQEGTLYLFSVN